jgi:hypothetical protein
VVVQSLRLAGLWGLHVARQHKEVGQNFGNHTRNLVAMAHSRRSDAQGHVQVGAGSEVLDPYAGVLQSKVVVAEDSLALRRLIEGRISKIVEAVVVLLPAVETHPPAEGKKHAQIQQTVLVDEMENEVRTWAGTGNPDVQAYWD